MKKIITILFLTISLFGFDPGEYQYMISDHMDENGTVKNQSYINDNFGNINMNGNKKFSKDFLREFKKKFKGLTEEQARIYLDSFYRPNEFLTKEESLKLLKYVYEAKKESTKYSHFFLLYFFTENVPRDSMSNILLGTSLLQKNGIDINIKEYLTGPSDNIKEYLFAWKDYIQTYPIKYQNDLAKNFHLKFDPRFFKVYEIEKAPALALAHCQSLFPTPKTCKVDYLIRGDVSLITFFDKISKIDKKYTPYKKILEANGIYKLEETKK